MSECLSSGNTKRNPLSNDKGSATRMLLLVLLLLVAIAGYLYYFTDLIRPQQGGAKPAAPVSGPIKQPIPPRPGQPGETAAVPAKPVEVKPVGVAPAPATATAPAATPAAAPTPVPAQAQTGQKPAPAPAKAKTEPAQSAKTEPPAKPALPPAAAAKPAPAPQPAAAPVAGKAAAPAKPVQKAEKPVATKKGGAYRLLIGDYGPGEPVNMVLAKLKKSSIAPVQKKAVQAVEPMNRLFVAEFGDQDSAEAELQKLRKLTGDAFLLADSGKYILYAGSYLSATKAASEAKKLASRGVTTVVKQARVAVKVTRVTAGSYASAGEARSDAARLKKRGISASVVTTK